VDTRRHLVFQASVWPTVVVDPHSLFNCTSCLLSVIEGRAESELLLEDSIQSLRVGVLIAVIFLSHAHRKVSALEDLHILMAAVLTTAVRMVNWISVRRKILKSPIERNEV